MLDDDRSVAAKSLREAVHSRTGVDVLTSTYSDISVEDAYAIQLLNVADRLASGDRVVRGHKIGLTSQAMRDMFGVDEPDYGHLLDDMFIPDGSSVAHSRYLHPRVEPEIAFVLDRGLDGPELSAADVMRATAYVVPALEIIDTRYYSWQMKLQDTIADNASSAGVVLGATHTAPTDVDLKTVGGLLRLNGEVVETGAGGAVLGHPAAAVAWLANALSRFGVRLEAGHVVMPGSITRAVDVGVGDHVQAEFDGLGVVGVRFD